MHFVGTCYGRSFTDPINFLSDSGDLKILLYLILIFLFYSSYRPTHNNETSERGDGGSSLVSSTIVGDEIY